MVRKEFYQTIVENVNESFLSVNNLKFKLKTIFKGIDFKDKRVLDIGGGAGVYSFYAAEKGAKEVVLLEPELEGSSGGFNEQFNHIKNKLNAKAVSLQRVTFQDFDVSNGKFDIVLLYNSINHLNEEACIVLRKSEEAREAYAGLFDKLSGLSNENADLIICDCSNYNFFQLLKIRNPFTPSIEWEKHQTPEFWTKLLKKHGFGEAKIKWSAFPPFRTLGKWLFAHKLGMYFTASHFCLYMKKNKI